MVATVKNPSRVERGRLGALARWGDAPRIVRLHELTPTQRRLVMALVEAARAEATRAPDPPGSGKG